MDGFKRPIQPPVTNQTPSSLPPVQPSSQPMPQPERPTQAPELPAVDMSVPPQQKVPMSKERKRRKWPLIVFSLIGLLIVGAVLAFVWYSGQIEAVDKNDTTVQRVEIVEGSSFGYVADSLKERGLIRSAVAFNVLASLEGKRDMIKAGTCNLTPAEPAREILNKITAGCHDFKSITFYPGATLNTSLYAKTKAEEAGKELKDPSIRASLEAAGFSNADIDEAFAATYEGPLFADKPAKEGYEGYIFGETYYVNTDATAKEVLQIAFDQMYKVVKENDLVAKFEAQGLNLYEGITLASIVEKELDCEGKPTEERKQKCYGYQQQIARVFYNRLDMDMSLGSDVTSIYASDKLGVASTVDVDSPYNTRKYPGLTPGPIATPGKLALLSVANPANGGELYFLAGDDGLIYFAKDEAGHNANIKNHCQTLCGDL